MAITLPIDNQTWPLMRILTRKRWGSAATSPHISGTGWKIEQMEAAGIAGGFRVIDFDRCCLPMIGRARFMLNFGRINQENVGASASSSASAVAGNAWNPATDHLSIANLVGHEIRIQGARSTTDGSTPTWRTIWWGECESQEDAGWPGASFPSGERIYHCVDGLARLQRWMLDRHGLAAYDTASVFRNNMRGHPGYNVSRHRNARIAGNRWNGSETWTADSGGTALYHGMPGSAGCVAWTDQEAIENAMASSRRPQDPTYPLSGSLDRLQGASSWPVNDGDNCMDLLVRVLRRERGKGLAFLDWTDDSADPTGPLTIALRVRPQMATIAAVGTETQQYGVTYIDPVSSVTVNLDGSYQAGTNAGSVDLIGDHRVVDEVFKLGDRNQYRLDAIETVGERIEVLVTLAYQDGISGSTGSQTGRAIRPRWSAADQTAFRALTTASQRIDERWRPVYQLHGLPYAWDFVVGDGDGNVMYRCDYRCNGEDSVEIATLINGAIIAESQFAQGNLPIDDTSVALVEVMGDLPLYEHWDYRSSTPARWDLATEQGSPQRRPVLGLLRVSANKFLKWEETTANLNMQVDGSELLIYNQANSGDGKRIVSDTTVSSLTASYNYSQLAITVGLRLPHRVRFYSGLRPNDPDCKRKATIYHADHHLWLAHPGAIWDIDGTTGSASLGHTPRRAAAGAAPRSPGLLRDDRSALARLHYLAWSWYSAVRRSATWAIRDCGMLGTYLAYQGSTVPTDGTATSTFTYPTLGQVIDQLKANGEVNAINTPVTRILYDHATGTTTWSTDWNELDLE